MVNKIILLFILMGLCSCSGKFTLQKRIYTKGYYLAFSSNKQAKHSEPISGKTKNDLAVINIENKLKTCSDLKITTDEKAETENLLSSACNTPATKPRLRSYAPEKITNAEVTSKKERVKFESKAPSMNLNSIPGFAIGFMTSGIVIVYIGVLIAAFGGDAAVVVGFIIIGIGALLMAIAIYGTLAYLVFGSV